MSLRPEELALVGAELDRELRGGVVQKVHAPTTTRVYLEVRIPGRSVTLLVSSDAGLSRLSVVEERPANPPTPPTWQSVLRAELTGAKLLDVEVLPLRRTAVLHFTKAERALALVLEVTSAPCIVLCTREGRVRTQSVPSRPGLRVGQVWAALEEQPKSAQPSRLQSEYAFLRLAHAAEALLVAGEQKVRVDARKAPLLAKKKRLLRTIEKVRDEANRDARATQLREEGELLKRNLHRLQRGLRTVQLTTWDEGGERSVELTLDPARSPQQEVEHRFHQYRRFVRGAAIARERLALLEAELSELNRSLASLDAEPVTLTVLPVASPRKRPEQQPSLPYREYRGHGDQRIWVGRGSSHNDTLTFHVARPNHVWFHARGVPGAHVVVPLEKGRALNAETLLDAAHLAAHHSDAKGEPRVEVSYTPVKFVHKQKDAAPGAVLFTREKTLLLRVDRERLERLLASVERTQVG